MQRYTLFILLISGLHNNLHCAAPKKLNYLAAATNTLPKESSEPKTTVALESCSCADCNFMQAQTLCRSAKKNEREAGSKHFKTLIKTKHPLAPFARIELAQLTQNPAERTDLLMPVITKNESFISDESFAYYQLQASFFMLQAFQEAKQLKKAFFAARNAFYPAYNELPISDPSLACYIHPALTQIADHLRADNTRKLAVEWPEFDNEAADMCAAIDTTSSRYLRAQFALETGNIDVANIDVALELFTSIQNTFPEARLRTAVCSWLKANQEAGETLPTACPAIDLSDTELHSKISELLLSYKYEAAHYSLWCFLFIYTPSNTQAKFNATYEWSKVQREQGKMADANRHLAVAAKNRIQNAAQDAFELAREILGTEGYELLQAAATGGNVDAQETLGIAYYSRAAAKNINAAKQESLLRSAKQYLSNAAKHHRPLAQLKYADIIRVTAATEDDHKNAVKLFTAMTQNPTFQFHSRALVGLGDAEDGYATYLEKQTPKGRTTGSPKQPSPHEKRIEMHHKKATEAYEKALRSSEQRSERKEYIHAGTGLANLLMQQQQPIRKDLSARKILDTLNAKYPNDPKVLIHYGILHSKLPNIALLKKYYVAALKAAPEKKFTRETVDSLLKSLKDNKQYEDLKDIAQEIATIIPDYTFAHICLAHADRAQGAPLKALEHLHAAATPTNALPHYMIGLMHLAGDKDIPMNITLACDYFKRAVAIDPNQGNYWHSLYKAHMFLGEDTEAVAALKKSAKLNYAESVAALADSVLRGYGGKFAPNKAIKLYEQASVIAALDQQTKNAIAFERMQCFAQHQDKGFIKKMIAAGNQLADAIIDFEHMRSKTSNPNIQRETSYTIGILHAAAAKATLDPIKQRNHLLKATIAFDRLKPTADEYVDPRYLYRQAHTKLKLQHILQPDISKATEDALATYKKNLEQATESARAMYEKIVEQNERTNPHNYFLTKARRQLNLLTGSNADSSSN